MNTEGLLQVTKTMKLEIMEIILNADLTSDREAQRTLMTINELFDRLNMSVDDVIPQSALRDYFRGVDEATKALSGAGVNPVNGLQASISSSGEVAGAFATQVHYAAIAEITDNTMLDLKAAIRTAQQNTYFTLQTTLADVKEEMQQGILRGDARRKITQRVAQSFAEDGMTSFITRDGKSLDLDFYSEVVTRTNLKLANTNGAIARYRENNQDYVKISGNTPTCEHCYAYRGLVLNLSGTDDRFLPAEGNLPPYHPQCQCSAAVYVIDSRSNTEIEREADKTKDFDLNEDVRPESQKKAYAEKQALNRKNNYEKKRFADIQATLGDSENVPKTLGGFKRSKRSNSDNYKNMLREYQEARKSMEG